MTTRHSHMHRQGHTYHHQLQEKVLISNSFVKIRIPYTAMNRPHFTAIWAVAYHRRTFSVAAAGEKVAEKPAVCTADELHYVPVPGSNWKLALWRFTPSPQVASRNHPLFLLSGIGTNAVAYDLSPKCSFARSMCNEGFDTWIVEVRGSGLSIEATEKEIDKSAHGISDTIAAASGSNNTLTDIVEGDSTGIPTLCNESRIVTTLTESFTSLSERVALYLSENQLKIMSFSLLDRISRLFEGSSLSKRFSTIRKKLLKFVEARQNSADVSQTGDLTQKLVSINEESQDRVSSKIYNLQERFSSSIESVCNQLELIIKYDWDFDNYLEEDLSAAMGYIRAQSKPKDGKLLAIGHSMGGILLYALLSYSGSEGKNPGLAAAVTLSSSLDYSSSKSLLKLLLPLANPARALRVPAIPLGPLLAAAYNPLTSRPLNVMKWLCNQISTQNMMEPDSLNKLVQNGFCSISAKLLVQLATAFREGGLRNRSGKFRYKDHMHKIKIPILALAGNEDQICPPEAVYETVKVIPQDLVTYKVFGGSEGLHYAHYDLIGSRVAAEQVYPCIIQFLCRHD